VKLLLPEVRDLTPDDLPDLYDVDGPSLRAGFVLSVDGVIAVDGTSGPLSSDADKAVFRTLRTADHMLALGHELIEVADDIGPFVLTPSDDETVDKFLAQQQNGLQHERHVLFGLQLPQPRDIL